MYVTAEICHHKYLYPILNTCTWKYYFKRAMYSFDDCLFINGLSLVEITDANVN